MVSATECLTTNAACVSVASGARESLADTLVCEDMDPRAEGSAFVQSNGELGQRTQHVLDQTSRPPSPNKELLVATGLQADIGCHCVRTFSKFLMPRVFLFILPHSHSNIWYLYIYIYICIRMIDIDIDLKQWLSSLRPHL